MSVRRIRLARVTLKNLATTVIVCLLQLNPGYASSVGFEAIRVETDSGPQLVGGVWYPTDATPSATQIGLWQRMVASGAPIAGVNLPLLVISHGSGGHFTSHIQTAEALAASGMVVGVINHPGDNALDESALGTTAQFENRPVAPRRLIDHLTGSWRGASAIDKEKIGAFGFSAGAHTVLVAAGAVPDYGRLRMHCASVPNEPLCESLKPAIPVLSSAATPVPDVRVKAAVAAAPALGFLFNESSIRNMTTRVQVWSAELDALVPAETNSNPITRNLNRSSSSRMVSGAGHFSFLAPCSDELKAIAPLVCSDPAGFDRVTFQDAFNASVLLFFSQALGFTPTSVGSTK